MNLYRREQLYQKIRATDGVTVVDSDCKKLGFLVQIPAQLDQRVVVYRYGYRQFLHDTPVERLEDSTRFPLLSACFLHVDDDDSAYVCVGKPPSSSAQCLADFLAA